MNKESAQASAMGPETGDLPEKRFPGARGGGLTWSVTLPAVVLVAAIVVQGFHVFRQVHKSVPPNLGLVLPFEITGWKSRDVSLGSNEYQSAEAERVLNYDDVVYRHYSRGEDSFEVYIAYWGAGKMPTRMVASHTPDRCWTENGWQCVAMKFKQPETLRDEPLKPTEWRKFDPPNGGKPTYVMYWHLVEGNLYDYGSRFNAVPDPVLWWKDAVQQALLGSREQFFIRINSEQPLETLWHDPGFAEVLDRLARLGLAATAPSRN